MSIVDDLLRFLEMRLEEFLHAHPELELQAIEEQLRQQEAVTTRYIAESRAEEQRLQDSILATAQEIKKWHERVDVATKAKRPDLAEGAKQREADLLNQGNQLWGQMQGTKERIQQMEQLLQRAQLRRKEVRDRIQQMKQERKQAAAAASTSSGSNTSSSETESSSSSSWSGWSTPSADWSDLDSKFRTLEMEMELEQLKRQQQK